MPLVNDEDLSTPGGRIRLMRRAKGWKQDGFAKKLGVSQASVSQWENNNWLPDRSLHGRIASTLDCSETWLFFEAEKKVAS